MDFLRLVAEGDLLSLGVLVAILCFLGDKAVREHPRIRRWGFGIGLLCFVGYCAATSVTGTLVADELASNAFRGLFAAGIAVGFSWISISLLIFCYDCSLGLFVSWACRTATRIQSRSRDRRAKRESEAIRRRQAIEWDESEPDRERKRREAEIQSRVASSDQKRREDARANCELVFGLHAPEIGERFPRSEFDRFVAKYMTDRHSADDVELRATELLAIVERHRETVRPTPKFASLGDISRWFIDEKDKIDRLPIDDAAKKKHRVQLNTRYAELTERFMEELEP